MSMKWITNIFIFLFSFIFYFLVIFLVKEEYVWWIVGIFGFFYILSFLFNKATFIETRAFSLSGYILAIVINLYLMGLIVL